MTDHDCQYQDAILKLVSGQGVIDGKLDALHKRFDKLEKMVVGNGSDGLLQKFTKLSVIAGGVTAGATIIFIAVVRHFIV